MTVDCECGDKKALKRTRITAMPKVLLIQLMRFNGATGAKVDQPISGDFHVSVGGAEYELVGVLVHTGRSIESGHYYTVTRDMDSKVAYVCDDDSPVQQVEGAALQGALAKAYMLVYQREERRPREEPPQDVAHVQFRSRIAFKLVWVPPALETFVLVDDAGDLLNSGTPTGRLPALSQRQQNFALVRGSKYAAAAEALGKAA